MISSPCGTLFLMVCIADCGNYDKGDNARGPAIFIQKRVGKGGKLLTCHKFYTIISMKNNEGSNAKKGDKT